MKPIELIPIALVALILLTITEATLKAQNKYFRPYETWVTKLNELPESYGILHDVNDSSIVLTNSMKLRNYKSSGYHSISIDQIDKIKLRRKGKLWRSALIGIGVGAVVGGLIANLSYNDNAPCGWFCISRGANTAIGATGFGLLGGFVGTIVGLARISIPINGQKSNFKANEDRLYKR